MNDKRVIVVDMRGTVRIVKMKVGRKHEYLITDEPRTFAVFCDSYEQVGETIMLWRHETYLGEIYLKDREIQEGVQE